MDQIQQALQSSPPPSPSAADESLGDKRRSKDDSSRPKASKRQRYTTIACNECKRRKIKCNGQTPCERCTKLSLECIYATSCCPNGGHFKDTLEYKQMSEQIGALQHSVDILWSHLNAIRDLIPHDSLPPNAHTLQYGYDASATTAPPPHPPATPMPLVDPQITRQQRQSPRISKFQGPTSSAFNLNIARSSLQTMGIAEGTDEADDHALTRDASPGSPRPVAPHLARSGNFRDPIWSLNREEALRLCHIYEDEVILMYPILDIDPVKKHASNLFRFIDALNRNHMIRLNGNEAPPLGTDAINDDETDVLKLIMAIAMAAENGGATNMSKRLFDFVSATNESSLRGSVDIRHIKLLTLIAIYHFHVDDEGLAWRVIGLAARGCLELGLHRAETYTTMFQSDEQRASVVRLFWSIYVLDRRWSFGTGMSFALQDSDIDPLLSKSDSTYLDLMVRYSKIGSKVWRSLASADSSNGKSNKEEIDYLDYQITQWVNSIPDQLRYYHPKSQEYARYMDEHADDPHSINAQGGRAYHRLRIILYLRANQMRITLYRPALQSAAHMLSNSTRESAYKVVDIAKDTISVLTHINVTGDIYRTQQMCFNYFLLSALAVLFLAVSHAPAQFAGQCRDEFYQALDLVRGLSSNSHVSKRLWRTVRSLKAIGPKLGLYARSSNETSGGVSHSDNRRAQSQQEQHDASSAAMAMAGLAGHQVDESAFFAAHQGVGSSDTASGTSGLTSPDGMANDLTRLFEAAGGYGAGQSTNGAVANPRGYGEDPQNDAVAALSAIGAAGLNGMSWGNEEELNRVMRDMF